MDVSATFNDTGEAIRIVNIDANGQNIFVSYVGSASNLEVRKMNYALRQDVFTIATSATVN